MPIRPARPVYFTKLVLENIRCFSEPQELNLTGAGGRPARWTLLVGDNGVGKTTLLQCLARMRPLFNPPDEDSSRPLDPDPVEPEFAGEEDNDVLGALARSITNTRARLEAQLSFGVPLAGRRAPRRGTISTWIGITSSRGALAHFDHGGQLPEGQSPEDVEEPLVLAYGAGRHPKTIDFDKAIATDPVESLFNVEAALHDAEDLLYRLEFRSIKGSKRARRHLHSLKQALVEILSDDVSSTRDIAIMGPPISDSFGGPSGVRVTTPYGQVPLSQLSLGYQTMFAWTVDLAWRLIDRYPKSPFPLQEPAIVIVDEIDLHLHPHWQRDIRKRLTGHFPRVQFIATAHSPLMAQSSLDANVAVCRKWEDHVLILNDPTVIREWRLDQVITSELFGLASARPPEVEALFNRRRQLANRHRLSVEERRELADLDRQVGKMPTAELSTDQNAMDIIRRAAAQLEQDDQGK